MEQSPMNRADGFGRGRPFLHEPERGLDPTHVGSGLGGLSSLQRDHHVLSIPEGPVLSNVEGPVLRILEGFMVMPAIAGEWYR